MEVKKAIYIISSPDYKGCPKPDLPEVAFIGRSNVGKSSLINMLSQKQELAKISSNPGKTQLINHFLINETMYWVDLPGYGYAKVSQSQRTKWKKMVWEYFENRENLYTVFVLIDSRIEPQKIDIDFINTLGEKGIPFNIVYTKTDKESQSLVSKNINAFNAELLKTWETLPISFRTSAIKKTGRNNLLSYIAEISTAKK